MSPTPSTFSSAQSSTWRQAESFSPLHAVILSLITTLGGYVQFQYQSKKLSLFDEHRNIMTEIFVILFLYAMGLMAEFKLQNQPVCLPIIKRFTPLIGPLVVVLLLIILSPFLGLAALIIWALLMVEPTIRLFQAILQWLHHMYDIHFGKSKTITSTFDKEESGSPGIEENRLPV